MLKTRLGYTIFKNFLTISQIFVLFCQKIVYDIVTSETLNSRKSTLCIVACKSLLII